MELDDIKFVDQSKNRRENYAVEGLEERCRALQNILDETSKKNNMLELKIKKLADENMVLKADFEAKSEEVKTFRLAVKDKFEMERKLKEIQDKYEALQKTYKGFEEEAKKTKENIELIG
mmetsp:Transcript_16588/g.14427  ORF Transcript_16588/g.14427 Transcript_16588/m.14427 type:complete len:120 (-) Transcript_16588:4275-4634(-)